MLLYDLCLSWNWEYDTDFVRLMDETCAARGMTLLSVSASNLSESLSLLSRREIGFRALLDRASEADSCYLPLVDIARSIGARRFNPRELADRAYDKAAIHQLFLEDGIPTPRTIILPAYHHRPELPSLDLHSIGGNFTVKPALGGGGDGVIMEISRLEQIQSARQHFPEQQYLLQEHVTPKTMNGIPAWFRVIYCIDDIFVSYWNTTTHIYTPADEMDGRVGPPQPILGSLREITRRIARLCELDLFSTEIALTEDDRLLVVDYVNDPIDLRLQSRAADGVPNFIVERIAERIVKAIQNQNAP